MDFKTGGQQVILRLVEAYGFSTRQMLCDHLGVSKSTLATRFMRDIFPAEWVIQCAIETGTDLEWLVSGKGEPNFNKLNNDIISLETHNLIEGDLFKINNLMFDKAFLNLETESLVVIKENDVLFIADAKFNEIMDGKWLVNIDGKKSIKEIIRLPNQHVKVEAGKLSFECMISEIKFIAKIKLLTQMLK